ncbi:MAG: hypothetical protein K1Y36_14555 [Blastocatellia bacterium]|nr:hypothetical protein [Blastocatellia bacterium]
MARIKITDIEMNQTTLVDLNAPTLVSVIGGDGTTSYTQDIAATGGSGFDTSSGGGSSLPGYTDIFADAAGNTGGGTTNTGGGTRSADGLGGGDVNNGSNPTDMNDTSGGTIGGPIGPALP